MEERLIALEKFATEQKLRVDDLTLRLAVKDERERQIYTSLEAIRSDVDKSLSEIKTNIDRMKSSINYVGLVVIAAIVTAVMKFVISGGLFVP